MTLRPLLALILLCAAPRSRAQAPAAAPISGLGSIAVTSTRVADLTPEGVTIAVNLSLTPSRTVTVESIRLSGLSVNALPMHADPIVHPLQLPKDIATPLPQLTVKVFFRDLTTVAPLRQMMDTQVVHVQGQVNATLHATFIEKLALGTAHPVVALPFTQDVPIALPDSPYARQAADTILGLVQAGIDAGMTGASKANLFEPDWIKALRTQAPNAIFRVETRYTLEQNRKPFPIAVDLLAFQLAGGPILTTPEARTPWEYEPDFLARLQSGEARLTPQTTEVQLDSVSLADAAPASALRFTQNDFTLREQGKPTRTKVIVDEKSVMSVQVRNRVDPDNLLTITPLPAAAGWPTQGLAAASPTQTAAWPKLAVFRLVAKTPASPPAIELLVLSAHRDGALLRFDQPLDPAAFGSPVVGPEGVVAIVQDENTAAFLPDTLATPK